MNIPFWRTEPLSSLEAELADRLFVAHFHSVFRQNPSTVAMQIAAQGSNDYTQSLCAALLTTGGPHAPLLDTAAFLAAPDPVRRAREIVSAGGKVPGWGNGFDRDGIDKLWQPVDGWICAHWRNRWDLLHAVTSALHALGKSIWPNPSAYTAMVAAILSFPDRALPYLFVAARLEAWTMVFLQEKVKV